MLELQNVSKSYGDKVIFRDISFSLERGQSMVISAPSGKGKSTLLSIAGLLLKPTEGTVCLNGKNVGDLNEADLARERAAHTGFLFQHTQLLGSLRAIENVELGGTFAPAQAFKDKSAHVRAEELLDHLGLADWKYYYPSQMSVGQKRRVATARALLSSPELIIADEPTNDLDDDCVKVVTEALFELVRDGSAGLLIATHDKRLIAQADTCIKL